MRFRQVHLDFHTSEAIPGIGSQFSKVQFQQMLRRGHIDSITVFAKCHHGWAYFPSETNEQHPGLTFDLMGAMIEAAHEINVRTPVYLSAGLDEKLARRHPEWLIRRADESTQWAPSFMQPGYHEFCLHSPYLDILLHQVEEVVQKYDVDGLFLDIVGVRECLCQSCVATIRERGQDPRDSESVRLHGEEVYANYTRRVAEKVERLRPGLPIFHNGGHIRRGRRDLAKMNTHLELESLPTGGWGYDHFPLSARYVQTLGMPYLGMTGKFHTSWGEFGGYKHPNALRYETSLSIAQGARCSIGDQLHPLGLMDEATYTLIGESYAEIERKEPWCVDVQNVADVALLSHEATIQRIHGQNADRHGKADAGAVRMLLEGHILFDVVDTEADFSKYAVIILPDAIRIDDDLRAKLLDACKAGSKLLATGESGLWEDRDAFAFDFGAHWTGTSAYQPTYFRPDPALTPVAAASYVMYTPAQEVEVTYGTSLGWREDPYFNRDVFTFCSHQHTPSRLQTGGPGIVEGQDGIYIAWNMFSDYASKGSLVLRQVILAVLSRLLPAPTLKTNLPAQGVVTLMDQARESRAVLHLLYASPVKRGDGIEVIEDLIPLSDVQASIRVPHSVKRVYLAPDMEEIPFQQIGDTVTCVIPKVFCHQMVVIESNRTGA